MDSSSPGLTFIVPAFNEEEAISATIDKLQQTLGELDLETEIIVVDDGSRDETFSVANTRDNVRVLRHPINAGYGRSIKTGIANARYEWIGIVDADGTYDIASIPSLVGEMCNGFDMVVANRKNVLELDSFFKKIFRYFFIKFLGSLMKREILDPNSGLRIFRRDLAEFYTPFLSDAFSFTTSLTIFFLGEGRFVTYVDIEYSSRTGLSKVRHIRDTLRTIQLVLQGIAVSNPIKACLLVCYSYLFIICISAIIVIPLFSPEVYYALLCFLSASSIIVTLGLIADILRLSVSSRRLKLGASIET